MFSVRLPTPAGAEVWQAKRTELKMSSQQPFFGGIRNGGKRTSPRTV
jgi:hypothetical protein